MKRKLLFITLCYSVFLVNCSGQENLEDLNSNPVNVAANNVVTKNVIIAHRGAWKKKNLPQNSIASLNEAIRLGCQGSEFDILLTADDSLVVNHDDTYNNLKVQNSNYSDLVTLKLSNGEKLPTLREYIVAAKQNNSLTLLYCEFKNYGLSAARRNIFVNKTLELVKKLNVEQLMVYISFDYNLLKEIRALDVSANVQYLGGDITSEQVKEDKISGLNYSYVIYRSNPKWIESARINGLTLNVYTVNDAGDLNWFLKNNFDAILTDEPELAFSIKIH